MKKKPAVNKIRKEQDMAASKEKMWIFLILAITFIAYIPALSCGFTRWDDHLYVTDTDLITSLSPANIARIFSTSSVVALNYHPLTIISLAIDYKFAKLNPGFYHTVNIIIHLINTYLVFIFIKKLSGNKSIVGLIVALFFGIHPMHVESVAWIAERKDVLYTFFFLLGLIQYLKYLETEKFKYIIFTFIFYALSVLSKAMAVVFPVVLLLIDYYKDRKINGKAILEKIPYFLYAIPFSLITLQIQRTAISKYETFSFGERIGIGFYGLFNYIWRLFLPVNLSAYYPYPLRTVTGSFPQSLYMISFLGVLIVAVVLIYFFLKKKNYKLVFFGFMFYVATIILVLQFLSVGQVIVADRYSYLSYIGLLFLVVMLAVSFVEKRPYLKRPFFIGLCAVVILFTLSSNVQSRIWKNTETLWTNVIERNPNMTIEVAHEQRGNYRSSINDFQGAIEDYEKCLNVKSKKPGVYFNLGIIYGTMGNDKQKNQDMKGALEMYQKSVDMLSYGLLLDSTYSKAYMDRATTYVLMNKFNLAAKDFTKMLEFYPDSKEILEKRAYVNGLSENYNAAIEDYTTLIKIDPANPYYYFNRGFAAYNADKYNEAIKDFDSLVQSDSTNGSAFYALGRCYQKLGDSKKASANYEIAKKLGVTDQGQMK
jgi:lipoprotein NlpI